jgi:hypothetical protein
MTLGDHYYLFEDWLAARWDYETADDFWANSSGEEQQAMIEEVGENLLIVQGVMVEEPEEEEVGDEDWGEFDWGDEEGDDQSLEEMWGELTEEDLAAMEEMGFDLDTLLGI